MPKYDGYRNTPLLNGAKSGRSAEEIKEHLLKCTENVIKLEKYNDNLEDGRAQSKSSRSQMHDLIVECGKILKRSQELLSVYDGNDAPVFRRKMNNIAERLEDVSSYPP
jgi:hypothetical protein